LASVSLFLERIDPDKKPTEHQISMGATHTLAQRIAPDGWLTAVGEVPMKTLKLFASRIERAR
ncbi:MucB/RseB C-terminal domain-containing protein, partial [Bacillus cereus group sp. Bce004]|uniref:MucB/RseB C-terminal domain-containing protein n=1 Tax=Bacillus cereus group sp. Bce004 TaxID=3445257 RepID=UPI003F1F83DA